MQFAIWLLGLTCHLSALVRDALQHRLHPKQGKFAQWLLVSLGAWWIALSLQGKVRLPESEFVESLTLQCGASSEFCMISLDSQDRSMQVCIDYPPGVRVNV